MIINFRRLKTPLLLLLCLGVASSVVTCGTVQPVGAGKNGARLTVVMYHHILKSPLRQGKYVIGPDEFESDLIYLRDNGYKTVMLRDLTEYTDKSAPLPEKPVMITFDDGYESIYEYAYPLLVKYKMNAVVNIIGKYTDLYSEADDHSISYSHLTWEQLAQMREAGVIEVGNHTYDMHSNGERKGIGQKNGESASEYEKALCEDLTRLQERAKEKLGEAPAAFAYPFGKIPKDALALLKKNGFKVVFCCWEKVNLLTGNPQELYHLNRFNRPHGIGSAEFFSKIENSE